MLEITTPMAREFGETYPEVSIGISGHTGAAMQVRPVT
jgi:hypothetical protein